MVVLVLHPSGLFRYTRIDMSSFCDDDGDPYPAFIGAVLVRPVGAYDVGATVTVLFDVIHCHLIVQSTNVHNNNNIRQEAYEVPLGCVMDQVNQTDPVRPNIW